MNEIEFNLIDEPWIRVMDSNCNVSEVSLKDAILNAHNYKSLSGELPTQDIAVMRLMLAVLHTVYSRADENGNESPLEDDEDESLNRWQALWKKGRFSEKAIGDYFETWHERFWLFHPERPFAQVAGLNIGTDYDAPKLNGEISESSNKVRFFSMYSGNEKSSLTYPQATRWLLYLNAYDDTSSKPTKEGKAKAGGSLPSPGVGWLGKLGLIYITGNNLFETLMLNLIMVNENVVQESQNPLWEQEKVSRAERTEIALPSDLAALYTLQSRRVFLIRKDGKVSSYKLLGGDFFEKENAFFEPMTVWNLPKKDGSAFTPKRHDSSKQMWREFSVLFGEKGGKQAGVLRWFKNYLQGKNLIPRSYLLKTSITAVEYGDKDFFVKNVYSDSLTMHAELLSDLGADWRAKIETEIDRCGKLANIIAFLAQNLYVASGGSNSKKDKHYMEIPNVVKSQLYYRFDMPFRKWLLSVDPESVDEKQKYDKQSEWQDTARRITEMYAQELVSETAETAITGHKEGDILYSSPKAMIIFKSKMKKIYGEGR